MDAGRLPVSADALALDIATGTGEFARAIAPQVTSVIGLDATQAMMEQGKIQRIPSCNLGDC